MAHDVGTIDPGGKNISAHEEKNNGLRVFTPDMHFVKVLTDADVPRFASNARGEGTDDENRAAMSRSIGFFGTYTVDEKGEFSWNRVEGATFPNWVGSVRTRDDLTLVVTDLRPIFPPIFRKSWVFCTGTKPWTAGN